MVPAVNRADRHGPLLLLPALLLQPGNLLLNSLRPDVRNFMGRRAISTAMPVPILLPSTSTIYPPLWYGESGVESVQPPPQTHPRAHDLIGRD